MKKAGFFIGIGAIAIAAPFASVHADGCQISYGQYGTTQNCAPGVKFSIMKQVKKPGTNDFVDNLSTLDPRFHAGNSVDFKVTVQNTGSVAISRLDMADVFPQTLTFKSGVAGTYDSASHTLRFSFNDLQPGATKDVILTAQVNEESTFPKDQNVFCVNNLAQAVDTAGNTISDTAQLCIEKTFQVQKGGPVKTTPPTGPEMIVLPILGATGFAGRFLRRKSKINN
jgi:uncharacterized repeat protein (TIGR01451 family)